MTSGIIASGIMPSGIMPWVNSACCYAECHYFYCLINEGKGTKLGEGEVLASYPDLT